VKLILFWITLTAEVASAACVAFSAAFPGRRIWPPPRRICWQAGLMWLLFVLSGAGMVGLGVVDWGSAGLAWWVRLVAGLPLWLGGSGLGLGSALALGYAPTLGSQGELILHGPYRFSRNPQYVGFIVSLFGWAIFSGSSLTLLAALVGAVALALAPFAEEPWLLGLHGPAYEAYRRTVPRLLSLRKILRKS